MAPFPYAYEAISLPTLPRVPLILAFAVQCIDNPFFFLQVCLCADFACAHGLLLSAKLSRMNEEVSFSYFCKLQSHLTILCSMLSFFPALNEPISISIQDTSF